MNNLSNTSGDLQTLCDIAHDNITVMWKNTNYNLQKVSYFLLIKGKFIFMENKWIRHNNGRPCNTSWFCSCVQTNSNAEIEENIPKCRKALYEGGQGGRPLTPPTPYTPPPGPCLPPPPFLERSSLSARKIFLDNIGNLTSPGCQSVNILNLFDRTNRRHRSHGSRKYNKPEVHDVSFDGLLSFVDLQL